MHTLFSDIIKNKGKDEELVKVKETIKEGRSLGIFAVGTLILMLLSEYIVKGSLYHMWISMIEHPIEYMIMYGLLLGILLLAQCLFKRIFYSYLVISVLVIGLAVINYYKIDMKGEFLGIQDLMLAGEFSTMAGDLNIIISPHLIWGALWLSVLVIVFKTIGKSRLSKKTRYIGLGIGCMLSVTSCYILYAKEIVVEESFLLNLVASVETLYIEEPTMYDEERVKALLKDDVQEPKIKPHVIMIMNESYFDVRTMPNIHFSINPQEHFQSYSEAFTKGIIVGPKKAGYTAQTEYEVLTGHSVDFTGVDQIAYLNYIEKDIPSLAHVFKDAGYRTEAIHPYDGTFYKRDQVYPFLGFDTFMSQDDFEKPKYINGFIADETVFDKVVARYEANPNEPLFCHVVTMQNHMPYVKMDTPRVEVKNEDLSEEAKDSLACYASAVYETDQALNKLISYFEEKNEPVVMMMFGDHIPVMEPDVYDEIGYFQRTTLEDDVRMSSTPFLFWNNYGLLAKDYGYVDSSYLGAILLNEIGFKQDRYFNYLYDQMQTLRAFHSLFYIDGEGNIKPTQALTEKEKQVQENLWVLQYDRLFGAYYSQ